MSKVVDVVLQAFRAVERRDRERLLALYHPDVEFCDAPSLPYGGTLRGKKSVAQNEGWLETWGPLQPTEAERSMEPRVVAAGDREVVVLYRQRAVDAAGDRFDGPVLGLYEVRGGKFARAQMFHFDTAAIVEYLARARC
ncbi:MAG TPA: nuclear transport factor 2 family protein [Thermoleophilaceae bacterium]|nr:nuclear transport factor 2 family protein [Thermoleophilaceae bacterium]